MFEGSTKLSFQCHVITFQYVRKYTISFCKLRKPKSIVIVFAIELEVRQEFKKYCGEMLLLRCFSANTGQWQSRYKHSIISALNRAATELRLLRRKCGMHSLCTQRLARVTLRSIVWSGRIPLLLYT